MWTPRPVIVTEFEIVKRLADYPENISSVASEISAICFLPENTAPSDVVFVFGSLPRPEFFSKVHEIVESGISSQIILTGGRGYEALPDDSREADVLHNYLKTCTRYNDVKIWIDNTSSHTFDNIVEAKKIFDFSTVRTISAVAMHYASQRQLQTLKSYLPDAAEKFFHALPYVQALDGHPVSVGEWHKHDDARKLVWGEVMRLYWYEKRGYIRVDQEILDKITHVFNVLNFTL